MPKTWNIIALIRLDFLSVSLCAQDITTRTELVLADRFARIVTVDTYLSGL